MEEYDFFAVRNIRHIAASFAMVQGVLPIPHAILVYWFLSIEMGFYVLICTSYVLRVDHYPPVTLLFLSPGDLRHLGLDRRDLIRQLEGYGYGYGYGYGVYSPWLWGRRIYGKDVAPNFKAYSVVCGK